MACADSPSLYRCANCDYVHRTHIEPDACHICGTNFDH